MSVPRRYISPADMLAEITSELQQIADQCQRNGDRAAALLLDNIRESFEREYGDPTIPPRRENR